MPTRAEAAVLAAVLAATPVALPPVAAPAADPAPAVVAGPTAVPPPAVPAVQPANKDKTGSLSRDEAREPQSRLKAAGFDPGPIDGIVGPRTTEAARRYGEARVLRATDPSKDMLVRLRGEPTQSAELSR